MSLTSVVLLGCALACPVGMGLMMWFMGKGTGARCHAHGSSAERDEPDG